MENAVNLRNLLLMELTSGKGAFSVFAKGNIKHYLHTCRGASILTPYDIVIQHEFLVFIFRRETQKIDRTSSGIVKIPAVIEYYGY